MADHYDTQQQPRVFHPFPRLLRRIQHMIWDHWRSDQAADVEAQQQQQQQQPKVFHPFLRLPRHIQHMIWDYWREDQMPVHHYCLLGRSGRFYAACEIPTMQLIRPVPQSVRFIAAGHRPLDPMEARIQFTNIVGRLKTPAEVNDILSWKVTFHGWTRHLVTWVNFDRDVFVLCNTGYQRPGMLRFLFTHAARTSPPDIADSHWARRIRKLAIWITPERQNGPLLPVDRRGFAQLTDLRVVYLVPKAWLDDAVPDLIDFVNARWDFFEHLRGWPAHTRDAFVGPLAEGAEQRIEARVEKIRDELTALFRAQGRDHVVIETVGYGDPREPTALLPDDDSDG